MADKTESKIDASSLNIYKKIQFVKKMLVDANIQKTGENSYSKYTYYNLGDFLPYIIKFCSEIGLFTDVQFEKEKATLEIINTDNPQETKTYEIQIAELDMKGCNKMQSLGGVQTYARRYLYMNAFDISENDLLDGADPEEVEKEKVTGDKGRKLTEEEAKVLYQILQGKGFSDDDISRTIKQRYNADKLDSLTLEQRNLILKSVENIPNKQG